MENFVKVGEGVCRKLKKGFEKSRKRTRYLI
jgi:hypothetical protein